MKAANAGCQLKKFQTINYLTDVITMNRYCYNTYRLALDYFTKNNYSTRFKSLRNASEAKTTARI